MGNVQGDMINNIHYSTLFITRVNKSVSQEELKQICEKYGKLTQCKLQMGSDRSGQVISLGKAVVGYSTKDEAAEAQKKLYFEDRLGDMIQIDFYKNKQLRMVEQQNYGNENFR